LTISNKTLIVIAGPTASGKTKLAIELAKHYRCPIVSADSRQVFKELNIGVARPSESELSQADHYFIASHSISQEFNAGIFEKEALTLLQTIFTKHQYAVLCGGTGLYIQALLLGLDVLPEANLALRHELSKKYLKHGLNYLQERLQNKAPEFYENCEKNNPQRLMRAIEIVESSEHSKKNTINNITRDFKYVGIYLNPPREELYENINKRVEKMIVAGLEAEVKAIFEFKHTNALQTVGYKEWIEYFEGKQSKEEVIEKIKQHTRNYAKRQVTWFKNKTEFVEMQNSSKAYDYILNTLKENE
jgi:tRNA dimethylallyltransferase